MGLAKPRDSESGRNVRKRRRARLRGVREREGRNGRIKASVEQMAGAAIS